MTSGTIALSSPAKVNLFLKITGKRPDGYHNLASLFQTVSLYDQLKITLADEDAIHCSDPAVPTDLNNSILQAARLFRLKTGLKFSISVHLEKKIPTKAGLGGGSSNAATALWGINELLDAKVPHSKLQKWSIELGSDVPFFFSLGTAYCTGRGGLVMPLPSLSEEELTLIHPGEGLSTKDVYQQVDLNQTSRNDSEKALRAFFSGKREFFNDLETAAFTLCPSLKELKKKLNAQCQVAMLTGSGSSFFCVGGVPKTDHPMSKVRFCSRQQHQWYKGV